MGELQEKGNSIMIYLDNASTSWPKPPELLEQMTKHIEQIGASPGRGGYSLARSAEEILARTRQELASILGVRDSRHLSFTHNATHALNILMKGFLQSDDHVILSCFEHNAVLRPLERLKREKGITYDIFWCSPDGKFDLEVLSELKRDNTKLIVINHASNVTGVVFPIEEVSAWAQHHRIKILLDVSQTAGLIPVHLDKWCIDLAAGTGHKSLMGPTGTGFLYAKNPMDIKSLYEGGSPGHSLSPLHPYLGPERFEAGTLNITGVFGLFGSLTSLRNHDIELRLQKKIKLTEFLESELLDLEDVHIYCSHAVAPKKTPLVAMNIEGMSPNHLAHLLGENFNIACRPGLQCAPLAHQAINTYPIGTVRFSFGDYNTEKDIEILMSSLRKILLQRRTKPPGPRQALSSQSTWL
jgi:cysteine desulfurase/selenocysteine lyase